MTHTILLGDSVSARILTAELSGRAGAPVGAQADLSRHSHALV
jgi:hypothetical protein